MGSTIDYFFTPISGYAYLGHAALLKLAADNGATLRHRPMDSLAVFAAVETTPPPRLPAARLKYRQIDMQRWAACRRLPLVVEPKYWPTDSALASRAIIAADAVGEDAGILTGALMTAVWARDLDIAQAATIELLAAECGLDAGAILAAAEGRDAADRYADNTADAIRRGALGSPTVFVGDDMFFGQDRLNFVKHALADAPSA